MDHITMLEISRETQRAITKHGKDSIKERSWTRASAILAEEAGELVKEIIECYGDDNLVMPGINEAYKLEKIYKEALQTASVAVRIMWRARRRATEIQLQERLHEPNKRA